MSNAVSKIFTDTHGGRNVESYVGSKGEVFYDNSFGALRIADGLRPGGNPIGLEVDEAAVEAAVASYQAVLADWAMIVDYVNITIAAGLVTAEGWPFAQWNVNGETALAYKAELEAAWVIQSNPTSPPSPLVIYPAISSAFYNQLRSVLVVVATRHNTYKTAMDSKIIGGATLTVPDVIQNTVEEDLTLRVRYIPPTSPPSTTATDVDFVFGSDGSITFPDASVQTGASISVAELQSLVADATDFAAFKAAIAAL